MREWRVAALNYDGAFLGLKRIWVAPGEALAQIHLPKEAVAQAGSFEIHPGLLDACLQIAAWKRGADSETTPHLNTAWERVQLFGPPSGEHFWCHVTGMPDFGCGSRRSLQCGLPALQ